MKKLLRSCTVSMSIEFVSGMLDDLTKRYNVVIVSSAGQELDKVGQRGDVKTIAVEMQRHISLIKDLRSLWQMIKVIRKERPYIVHSITPKAGLLTMMAAWICRVPVRIHTFTGLVFPTSSGLKRRILMLTDWLTCACATHIQPEGEGVKADLLNNGITRKPLRVLGYGNVKGIDTLRFSRRPEIMEKAKAIRKDDVFTFLFVGRIVGDKGINELVNAFVGLHADNPKTRLLLVGFFEEKLDPVSKDTKRMINECEAIEYAGEHYGDELIAYYAAADCFVFPSYREGFPNTVIEAGAMGLPCIVTDINGSREIISNEKNGLIIPSHDSKSLQQAMKRIIEDCQLYRSLQDNSREMIVSRFSQDFVRQCLYEFYDEIA